MAKSSTKARVSLVVQSKVKELVKKGKMKCSSDVINAMNSVITEAVSKGIARAKANGRKTLRASDL